MPNLPLPRPAVPSDDQRRRKEPPPVPASTASPFRAIQDRHFLDLPGPSRTASPVQSAPCRAALEDLAKTAEPGRAIHTAPTAPHLEALAATARTGRAHTPPSNTIIAAPSDPRLPCRTKTEPAYRAQPSSDEQTPGLPCRDGPTRDSPREAGPRLPMPGLTPPVHERPSVDCPAFLAPSDRATRDDAKPRLPSLRSPSGCRAQPFRPRRALPIRSRPFQDCRDGPGLTVPRRPGRSLPVQAATASPDLAGPKPA